MRRHYIAVSLVFVLLPFTGAGVIKNVFTSLIGGKNAGNKEENKKQPIEYGTPGHDANVWHANHPAGSTPRVEYGGAGTYTKTPVVIDGTTEKYKNTSWYIENEDYLSPNKNESKQQKRPSSQYGAAGTYTIQPVESTTEKSSVNGNYITPSENQHRPTEFTNKHNGVNNQDNTGDERVRADATRSSIESQNATEKVRSEEDDKVVLQTDDITCCYSNLKDKIENRNLRCNEIDCNLDKVYEKSSLWVCDTMKCTVASVDFSQDLGSKNLLECSDGRNIITVQNKPLNCGPDEKEHNGRCRKVFGARKPDVVCGL